MTMRLPDFIIAGAPRSGTTWLYELLDRHPQVCMAKPARPEPKFFLVDELYSRGLDYYATTWFACADASRLCGEKSTNYLERPVVAERMARDVPHVKLVFILRDPVERAFSNYLWSCMNGMENDGFEEALAREEERERELPPELRYARPHAYFSRGLYAELLQPFFDRFPREQLLCLKFEDLVAHPAATAERLHAYLGVAARPEDGSALGVVNPSEKGGETLTPEARRQLVQRYAEPNRRLAELLGPAFQTWSEE